ncbi:anaerobic ribonucleoside-triphosphate reductase activating protein [Paenibacillus sp. JCM 10914]|uniref:anaerobic ribonucleoside-triphosphate reductase activating protein n=1 Tax=Paenibacillus sp. JCM 10914 TaxID=1236974 RepID=UPI0003CC9D7C|nr:anaerobic ribonucleoside-triphosphate reductase activating protein [Paenibacillus sp. JCM 10914]GAE04020.1 1,4-alpha-glucan (glycogen) branching enzyme, GH-13-type [Paenibacillus sp. JCM 10914]
MNICGYIPESINEGPGLRAVLFVSGCRHACIGCFNAESWNFAAGEPFTEEIAMGILQDIKDNPLLDGVTLCGGDPFFSPEECAAFVSKLKTACPGKNVWAYTGFTFEALMRQPRQRELAILCDVIVDGKFMLEQRDVSLPFRGSSNQRLIDVVASVDRGVAVEFVLR